MSVIPEQQADTELVTGIIQGITDKGGEKWQVAVKQDPTSQYTRNLWSSDAGLISQLASMIGQHQTFLCRISHWTRADGSPTRSLWIQGVGPQAAAPVAPMPPAPQAPTVASVPPAELSQRPMHDDREAKIHRQTATKVAAMLISHLPAEQRTFDNLLHISNRLVGYYEHGMSMPRGDHNPDFDGDPGPQGVPHGDSDIPF